jgi:hypothetical protein
MKKLSELEAIEALRVLGLLLTCLAEGLGPLGGPALILSM